MGGEVPREKSGSRSHGSRNLEEDKREESAGRDRNIRAEPRRAESPQSWSAGLKSSGYLVRPQVSLLT